MSYKFRRPQEAAAPAISNESAAGIDQFNPENIEHVHGADHDGRRYVHPETEEECAEVNGEIESLRARADAMHSARDAIGGKEVDRSMESFLVDTGLIAENDGADFSVESFDLLGGASGVPAALDRAIEHTAGEIRHLRSLTY